MYQTTYPAVYQNEKIIDILVHFTLCDVTSSLISQNRGQHMCAISISVIDVIFPSCISQVMILK